MRSGFNKLLRVVPGTARIVQHNGQQNARDRAHHEEAANGFRGGMEGLENQADEDGREHHHRTRANLALHNIGVGVELASYLGDHRLGCFGDRSDTKRGKQKDHHCTDKPTDKDLRAREIDAVRRRPDFRFHGIGGTHSTFDKDLAHFIEIG